MFKDTINCKPLLPNRQQKTQSCSSRYQLFDFFWLLFPFFYFFLKAHYHVDNNFGELIPHLMLILNLNKSLDSSGEQASRNKAMPDLRFIWGLFLERQTKHILKNKLQKVYIKYLTYFSYCPNAFSNILCKHRNDGLGGKKNIKNLMKITLFKRLLPHLNPMCKLISEVFVIQGHTGSKTRIH